MVVVARLLQLDTLFAVTVFRGGAATGGGGVTHSTAVIGGWRRWAVRLMIFLPEVVLVVMHPHFQNPPLNSDVAAESIDQIFIFLLNFPPNSLREFEHFLLLNLSELRAESFAAVGAQQRRRRGGVNGGGGNQSVAVGGRAS